MVGTVLIVLVFEAARRLMGWPLTVIAGIFLLYCFFGRHLPPPLIHRGYDFAQIVENFAFGTEGIYGTPIYVSASYIFIFVLFASFLERAGMIALFNDVALGLVGTWRGGPAQVCVLSSALMGTISGSGVANVVASGQFTIPLMKRFGFRSAFAGGVEATSSMGGQIMPPVMGAVAFIMAETLDVPYAAVVQAAIIPAVLYFAGCFWMVFLELGKFGLRGMARAELPNPWTPVREHWPLVLPLATLVYLLFAGYTPIFAGTMGLALTVVLILGMPLAARIGPLAFRLVFWVAIGLAAASFLEFGVWLLALVIAALVAACALVKGGRETLRLCVDALAEGAKNALPVGIACAIVGIVIGTLTLTGIASTFIGAIIAVGQGNLFLALVLTMLTCLVLGMGIPTIPNYIITSSIAGPALLALKVPLIVSHMFVFYFGIMADLTPPVALAAFAAAPMAKVSGMKIAVQATKLAVAGFVIPFMAVFTPALMLQDGGPLAARDRLSAGGGLRLRQGLPRDRALGGGGGGVPRRADAGLGAAAGGAGGGEPDRGAALDRRGGVRAGGAGRSALHWRRARARGVSLCIAGGETLRLAVAAFTLAWTHSVEHVRWEEDWRVTPAGLAACRGAGPGLRRRDGAGRRGAAGGRLVDVDARSCAAAGAGARGVRGDGGRLDALRRRDLPRARRGGGGADPAVGLSLEPEHRQGVERVGPQVTELEPHEVAVEAGARPGGVERAEEAARHAGGDEAAGDVGPVGAAERLDQPVGTAAPAA